MAQDPVCGMHVDERKPAATSVYGNRTFYFCSEGCKKRFLEKPEEFAARHDLNRKDRR